MRIDGKAACARETALVLLGQPLGKGEMVECVAFAAYVQEVLKSSEEALDLLVARAQDRPEFGSRERFSLGAKHGQQCADGCVVLVIRKAARERVQIERVHARRQILQAVHRQRARLHVVQHADGVEKLASALLGVRQESGENAPAHAGALQHPRQRAGLAPSRDVDADVVEVADVLAVQDLAPERLLYGLQHLLSPPAGG